MVQLAREVRLRELLHLSNGSPQHNSSPGSLQLRDTAGAPHSHAGKLTAPTATATWGAASPTKGGQQQQQHWRPGSPLATIAGAGSAADTTEPFKALQQQLLSDVDAVRKRQKPGFIRYASLSTRQLRPAELVITLPCRCNIRTRIAQKPFCSHIWRSCEARA